MSASSDNKPHAGQTTGDNSSSAQQRTRRHGRPSLHTLALVAELYPAHNQGKLGPIGRKKLLGDELRKRKSRSEIEAHKLENTAGNVTIKQPRSERNGYDNTSIRSYDDPDDNDFTDNGDKTGDHREVDIASVHCDVITGVPAEAASWFQMRDKKGSHDHHGLVQEAARKLRILPHSFSNLSDFDLLNEDGLSKLHLATQANTIGEMDKLIKRGANIDIQASLDGSTPLHLAVRYNCIEAVTLLLRYNADVLAKVVNGHTPMHIACRKGNIEVAKLMIAHSPGCVNARDNDMTTPLHQAAICGDVDLCTLLVEHGAQIRSKDINDVTPLLQAAQSGFKDIVQYLLSVASQVGIFLVEYICDVDNEGNTPLHLAVSNRHIHVARALIDRGAPTDYRKPNGFTALHQAAIFGEVGMVEMLIDRGAATEVTDNEQMTPLHRAALYNRVEVILLLIRQGLFLDARDEDNFTPLLCAAWKGQTDAGRSLLRYGSDIQAVDKEMKSCLHWAVEMQHLEFATMLFEHGHGGDDIIDWCDRDGQTPLHYAGHVGNEQLIKVLLKHSAKADVRDNTEKSALHIAAESGHLDSVMLLLDACPIPLNDDDIDDMTPLLLASENGHSGVVNYLIKMGADMSKRNDDRRSPLALAATENEIEVMTILLDNNADVNAIDKDKNTPLHLCAKAGHSIPTTLLLNCGADLTLQNIHGQYPLDVAIENKHSGVAKAILGGRFWQIAMNNRDSNEQTPMPRLIECVPDAAQQVMDQCVTRSHDDPHHVDLQITYDFSYIDPGPDDPSAFKIGRTFALEEMVAYGREKLLSHELSQSLLDKKWTKFAGWYNSFHLILYCVFLYAMIMLLNLSNTLNKENELDQDGCPVAPAPMDNTYEFYPSDSHLLTGVTSTIQNVTTEYPPKKWVRIVIPELAFLQFFLLGFVIFKFLEDITNLLWQKVYFFYNVENWMHLVLYITVVGYISPPYYPPCGINLAMGAMGMFVSWMNFIFLLQRVDFFGLYVTMFFTTLKSLLKAMVVYALFIVGFGLAFYMCFVNTISGFRDPWQSLLTTFVMTLGEINKADLFDSGEDLYPYHQVSYVIFIAFLFLMPMVLINLTIGISVGDIDAILRSSYLRRIALQSEMIFGAEKMCPKCLQRRLWQQTYTFFPNKRQHSLWYKIKTVILGTAKKSSDTLLRNDVEESSTIDDVMSEVARHEQTLSELTVIINKQSDILRRLAENQNIKTDL